jgi:uncharacterized membrane protein YphA (DoxX/SURF4 family)
MSTASPISSAISSSQTKAQWNIDRLAIVYGRLALGTAFLSAVASRFGFYKHDGSHFNNFASFVQYTAEVNSFLPSAMIPFVAWTATIAETLFGIALIVGFRTKWVAFGSSALLFLFATAMAISFGIKAPMDYSVYSASAGALLLGLYCQRSER